VYFGRFGGKVKNNVKCKLHVGYDIVSHEAFRLCLHMCIGYVTKKLCREDCYFVRFLRLCTRFLVSEKIYVLVGREVRCTRWGGHASG
jgi:hypothetical protein